jgi:serine/threonine-protein kinase HipA
MNRCPITYELCGDQKYSKDGLKQLSSKLTHFNDFPLTSQEQREMALQQASKLSIQGIQPKLSVVLNIEKACFDLVDRKGTFILKPPNQLFENLPQNEDLTMRLAKIVGLEVPLHGMIYNCDGSLTYFIKRFDRPSLDHKIGVEDFSQLMGATRDVKYDSSMEKMIPIIEQYCSFPLLEKIKFFRLTLFNFLVGNEDAHLKNFSLITKNDRVELSPVYDLVNSSIVLKPIEEIALPLHGKKSKLNSSDLFDYFGKQRLGLSTNILEEELEKFRQAKSTWNQLIENSFLPAPLQETYAKVLLERQKRLEI